MKTAKSSLIFISYKIVWFIQIPFNTLTRIKKCIWNQRVNLELLELYSIKSRSVEVRCIDEGVEEIIVL